MANPQTKNGFVMIAIELYKALAHIRISGEARQALDVIFRKTYGFHKKWDKISLSQFVLATGMPKCSIVRALNKLIKMNLIIYQKVNDTANEYSINKDFDTWQPFTKKKTFTKKEMSVYQKVNERLPKSKSAFTKKRTTKDTLTKDTLTKDTLTKDTKIKITVNKYSIDDTNYSFLKDNSFKTLWIDWLEVRQKKKAPNTDRALKIALDKLHRDSITLKTATKMLENAVEGGWKGIYDLKQEVNYGRYGENLTESEKCTKFDGLGEEV